MLAFALVGTCVLLARELEVGTISYAKHGDLSIVDVEFHSVSIRDANSSSGSRGG
jgi:hypothetical protein